MARAEAADLRVPTLGRENDRRWQRFVEAGWSVTGAVAVVAIVTGLSIPLVDVLSYPDRLSILPSLQVGASTYDMLAVDIESRGAWTDVPPLQPPGFVVILAVVYRAFGHSLVAAKVLLWLCLVMCTVLGGWLALRVWGRAAAVAAMVLVATSPALRHYVGTVQYEVVAGAGLLAVLGLALKSVDAPWRRSLRWGCAAGLSGGALTLVREVFIGVVRLIGVWMLAQAWRCSWRCCGPDRLVVGASIVTTWTTDCDDRQRRRDTRTWQQSSNLRHL